MVVPVVVVAGGRGLVLDMLAETAVCTVAVEVVEVLDRAVRVLEATVPLAIR